MITQNPGRKQMNKVILLGYLTKDPEIKCSIGEKEITIAKYTVAVRRKRYKEEEITADFFRCVSFGRMADIAGKYLKRGDRVLLTGRLQTGSYINRDGIKVYVTDVIVEELEFVNQKTEDELRKDVEKKSEKDEFLEIPKDLEEEMPFR